LERFDQRFPTISASVRAIGLDPTSDWLPIAPAAHYLSGGVLTDLDGASALPGLWACGEVACTGVHGANRLASNSLLEGMVFAARVVEAIAVGRDGPEPTGAVRSALDTGDGGSGGAENGETIPVRFLTLGRSEDPREVPAGDDGEVSKRRHRLQQAMTAGAGVVRSEDSLAAAHAVVEEVAGPGRGPETWELANLVEVSRAVLAAAAARRESRGAHSRSDFPRQDPTFRCRLALTR
jgi:L-aspartate oxidase